MQIYCNNTLLLTDIMHFVIMKSRFRDRALRSSAHLSTFLSRKEGAAQHDKLALPLARKTEPVAASGAGWAN